MNLRDLSLKGNCVCVCVSVSVSVCVCVCVCRISLVVYLLDSLQEYYSLEYSCLYIFGMTPDGKYIPLTSDTK